MDSNILGDFQICISVPLSFSVSYSWNNSQYFSDICVTRAEAVAQRCFIKSLFLKVLLNAQEKTCARDCLNQVY